MYSSCCSGPRERDSLLRSSQQPPCLCTMKKREGFTGNKSLSHSESNGSPDFPLEQAKQRAYRHRKTETVASSMIPAAWIGSILGIGLTWVVLLGKAMRTVPGKRKTHPRRCDWPLPVASSCKPYLICGFLEIPISAAGPEESSDLYRPISSLASRADRGCMRPMEASAISKRRSKQKNTHPLHLRSWQNGVVVPL